MNTEAFVIFILFILLLGIFSGIKFCIKNKLTKLELAILIPELILFLFLCMVIIYYIK